MTEALATQSATRMIFLGNAALTDGFRLIGFEALTDPSVEQLERLLRQLQESRANAFIVVDHALAEGSASILKRVRLEGGHIVITEVPTLDQPEAFQCQIDAQLKALFGEDALDNGMEREPSPPREDA